MLQLRRIVVATSIAACLPLLSVQGAAAEATNADDSARDVVVLEFDAGPHLEHHATRRPTRAHGDIRHLHANHAYRHVVVGLRFRNLNPALGVSDVFEFRTGSAHFSLDFQYTRKHIDTSPVFWNETRDTEVRCPRLKLAIKLAEDRVLVYVPRKCLNRPKWVRVGAETWTGSNIDFYDDALRRGRNDSDWTFAGRPTLGPRLSRGPAPRRG